MCRGGLLKQTQSHFFVCLPATSGPFRKRGKHIGLDARLPVCGNPHPSTAFVRRRFSTFVRFCAAARISWKRRPRLFSFGKAPVQTAAESHLSATVTALDQDATSLRRPVERDGARGPGPQLSGGACGRSCVRRADRGVAAFNTSEGTINS